MGKTSKEDLASIVGQRLKELRKAKTDLGQKDVADEIGITKQANEKSKGGQFMCQEKVENKIKFSGSCMDVNTGVSIDSITHEPLPVNGLFIFS